MINIISPKFKISSFKVLLLAVCIVLLCTGIYTASLGCSDSKELRGNSGISEMVIKQTDRGKSFDIFQGSIISIHLEENPTTGYKWEVINVNSRVLELQNSEYIGASESILGGRGLRIFTFEAKLPGVTQIGLKLHQEWEEEATAIESFEVIIRVIEAE